MFRSKRNRVFIHRYQLENIHALTLPKLALALHIFLTLIFMFYNTIIAKMIKNMINGAELERIFGLFELFE